MIDLEYHITNFRPSRPENSANFWEVKALKAFEQGVDEHFERHTCLSMSG
jgi:hypothetical protein